MSKFYPGDKAYLFGEIVTVLGLTAPPYNYPGDTKEWYRILLPGERREERIGSEKVLLTREEEVVSRLRGDGQENCKRLQ
jgi:hypothetical protein